MLINDSSGRFVYPIPLHSHDEIVVVIISAVGIVLFASQESIGHRVLDHSIFAKSLFHSDFSQLLPVVHGL